MLCVGDEDCKSGNRLVPHPEDCSKYLVCDTGSLTLTSISQCTPGKLFSTVLKSCQPDYTVTCTVGSSTRPPESISYVEGRVSFFILKDF